MPHFSILLSLLVISGCVSSQSADPPSAPPRPTTADRSLARIPLDSTYNLRTSYTVPDGKVVLDLRARRAATRNYRYLEVEYETEGGVGNENYRYLRAFAVGSTGDTTFRNLPAVGENTRASVFLELPADTLVAAGILKYNGGNTYARTTRERIRVHDLRMVDDLPAPPAAGEPADKWLIGAIYGLPEGGTLDLRGQAYLLRGQLLLSGLRGITLRNGTLYTDRNRFDNKGNRQDIFRLVDCHDLTFENLSIYGTRFGDYALPLTAGEVTVLDRWLSPHYERDRGPTYRIDLSGRGAGTIALLAADSDSLIATRQVDLRGGDAASLYFNLDDPLTRLALRSTTDGLVAHPYGSVHHVYANEFASGFYVTRGNRNVTILNCQVHTVMGDGFQVDRDARNTRIQGVRVNGASRQGGSVNGGIQTELIDIELFNTGRSGLDVEPYSVKDSVRGLEIRNLRAGNHKSSSFIAGNWRRIYGLRVDGLRSVGEVRQCWKGGGVGAEITNVVGRDFFYRGSHSRISQVETFGSIELDGPSPTADARNEVPAGNNLLDGFVIHRRSSTSHFMLRVDSTNVARNGLLRADRHDPDLPNAQTTAYLRGSGRVEDVRVEDYERYFPNMILDGRQTRPLRQAPSVRVSVIPGQEKGGRLPPGKPYYYEVLVVPRKQPPVSLGTFIARLGGRDNRAVIQLTNLSDPDNGYVYHELIVRRGDRPGRYDRVSHVRPLSERAGWNNRVQLIDTGDRLRVKGGLTTNNRFFGYADSYPFRPEGSR